VPDLYDAIVIGVGTMGAATCAELARRGGRVLGIDRFAPPHGQGSHHGSTRLFRKAYFEHPDYVPLLQRAGELWERANVTSGESIFVRTGGVFGGPPGGAVVRGTLDAARMHDLPVERLTRGQLVARFPQLRVPEGCDALFDHDAAVVRCEAAVAHFVREARAAGAEIHVGEPVIDWEERAREVVVRTERAEFSGRSLIVTCGAWASRLLPALGIPLVVTRQVLGWLAPDDPSAFVPDRFPVWGFECDDGSMHYGAPLMPGESGVKVALHARGSMTEPDRVDRLVSDADTREVIDGGARCLVGVASRLVDSRICLYTNSPDSNFIVGRLPGAERVFIACGFSGHGFKFAPVIGEVLADLATSGITRHPIAFLSPERFRS